MARRAIHVSVSVLAISLLKVVITMYELRLVYLEVGKDESDGWTIWYVIYNLI